MLTCCTPTIPYWFCNWSSMLILSRFTGELPMHVLYFMIMLSISWAFVVVFAASNLVIESTDDLAFDFLRYSCPFICVAACDVVVEVSKPILLNYSLISFISLTSWLKPMLTAEQVALAASYESCAFDDTVGSLNIGVVDIRRFCSIKNYIVSIYRRFRSVKLEFWSFSDFILSYWSSMTS